MLAIIKKEVKTYFLSPVGYVFIGTFLLMSSLFFDIYTWQNQSTEYAALFYSNAELLTFTIALLTMGMFAGERKNGTETLLFTSSRSITGIVIGKFLAAFLIVIITEILSLLYYVIVCAFAGGLTNVPETISALIGFVLFSTTYIAFGEFISSLTENQIIAGIATIVLLLATWFLPNLSEAFYMISPILLFDKFPQGIISISDTITLGSITLLFILLTITILQRKKSMK